MCGGNMKRILKYVMVLVLLLVVCVGVVFVQYKPGLQNDCWMEELL